MRDRLKKCSNPDTKPLDNHNHSHENCNNYKSQNQLDDLDNSERDVRDVKEDQKDLNQVGNSESIDHTLENLNIAKAITRKRPASIDEILEDSEVSSYDLDTTVE